MATNIDKSLGEIISSRKTSTRGRRAGRRGGARAPVGGIAKNVAKPKAPAKAAVVTAAANPASLKGNKKIMISGMPSDVTVEHLKEYFGTKVGPIQKVELSYGPNGVSRGVATIIFRGNVAQQAVADHNGLKIDNKHAMKIEVIYDAKSLPPVQAPKSLNDRVNEPAGKKEKAKKEQPKKVKADERGATAATKGGRGGAKRGRNAGRPRPKKKTADELDAEMVDYFDGSKPNGDGAAPAAAAPAGGAPAAETMDEVL